MKVLFIVFGCLIGAAMGSFACCQAWRIRLKEEKKKDPGKRSVCLSCGKKLSWYENIPIISWILLKGKCKKCGKPIGKIEILAELFGCVSFGAIVWSFLNGIDFNRDLFEIVADINIPGIVAVLAAMVGLMIVAIYDGKWEEMPISMLLYSIIMGFVYAIIICVQTGFSIEGIIQIVGSVGILAGVYYLLYFFSKEKLVGGGDWILCVSIGLLLADWRLALIELFLANFIGAVVMLPLKQRKIPFGPFLVVAFVLAFVFREYLISALMIG